MRRWIIRKIALLLSILITILMPCSSFAELTEDQAFALQVRLQNQTLIFSWDIAPNHYLYKKQLALINEDNISLLTGSILPAGTLIKDEFLGEYEVYSKNLSITVPWDNQVAEGKLLLRYQGCAKGGFCYLPLNKLLTIKAYDVTVEDTTLQEFPAKYTANRLADMLQDKFLPLTLLIFFCLGILLSFTPCVLPMIPLVVNLIVGPKVSSSRKALILASSYVLGMAACYTVAGIIAGMLGATLQAWLQQPVILITLSILLVLLALAQFDMIHVSLPHFNKRLHHWSQKQLQGSYFGAFILGILSALIVSPCITPPLIGALTYISQNGNPVVGGLALLCLGLGMGVPLIVVAMLSSMILPKAGEWMNIVKTAAGLALLGLAIWLVQRIIPMYVAIILWGALCIVAAILLKAFSPLKHPKKAAKLFKAFGLILAVLGTAIILNTVYVQFIAKQQVAQAHIRWQAIDTLEELEQSLAIAKKNKQPTLVEFYAYWCTSCKRIEATVFTDQEVVRNLAPFNLLRVDLTNMTPKQKELLAKFKIYGPPALIFFNSEGTEIRDKRVIGEITPKEMLQLLTSMPV